MDTNNEIKTKIPRRKRYAINLITKEQFDSTRELAQLHNITHIHMINILRKNTKKYLHAESIRLVVNNLDAFIFVDRLPEIEGKVVYE